MKFTSLPIIFTLTTIASCHPLSTLLPRARTCYNSISLTTDEFVNVRDTMDLLCVFSDFHDTFSPSQQKTDCLSYDRGVFARITIKNLNGQESKRLAADECKSSLHAVFDNCSARAGGKDDNINNWGYEVAVSTVACPPE